MPSLPNRIEERMRIAVAAALLPTALFAAPHMQPLRSQEQGAVSQFSSAAAPANAYLFYYGGPVISNVKVVPVMWNSSVPSDVQSTMPNFYAAVTNSTFWSFLSEYDTNILDYGGAQGTNQHIGPGTATKAIVLTPSITATAITDAQIQSEIQHQISIGKLPAPDANTLYMVHYPAGMSISMPDGNGGTAASCKQFCAYHGTIAGSPNIYYGTIPNVTTDGCELGCGPVGGGINNETMVSSHELVEATTDSAVGLATNNAPPLGWYDPQGQDGEIGDICNASQGTITANGQSWTVQAEWSNSQNACVTGPASNDFALELSPSTHPIAAGSSATYTVVSKVTAGSPGSISLVADGLPTGFTATFSPTTISPGGTATLSVSVSSSAANGEDYFSFHGNAGSVSRAAKGTATVTGGTGSGGGGGGGCPAGTIDLGGGVCVPIGCSTSNNGLAWAGAAFVGLMLALRRRRS